MAAPNTKLEKRLVPTDPKYDHYDFPIEAPTPQNGHPGWTTEVQDAQVTQLRMMLEQAGYKENLDTLTLLRFLRARKFDVEASKTMFINCEKWRSEFGGKGLTHLLQNFEYKEKPEISKFYPQYYHKTDKDGRPIYIEHLGNIDIAAMHKITTEDRMLQNLVCEYEKMVDPRLPACSRKSGVLLETCCTIMDFKGVGLAKAPSVYGYIQKTSGVSQDYYPERLGKLYLINTPWGFSTVFSFVKRFLDPVTVAKIHVLGSGYQKELLAQVAPENLPKELGGTCECPGGCQFSDAGPWHDPQWVKPPKWAVTEPKSQDTSAIEDQPSLAGGNEIKPGSAAADVAAPAKPEEAAAAKGETTKGETTAGAPAPAAA